MNCTYPTAELMCHFQLGDKDVFNFNGATYFFDYLRKEGDNSVDKYLHLDEKSSWKKSITLVNLDNKNLLKSNNVLNAIVGEKVGQKEVKLNQQKSTKVMKEDREYLKNLERVLLTKKQDDKVKVNILKTVKNANDYLQERELFWMHFE